MEEEILDIIDTQYLWLGVSQVNAEIINGYKDTF